MLQNAAIEAVRDWVYSPLDAETQTLVKLNFVGDESLRSPGGNIMQAVLISRVEPVMPKDAAQAEGPSTVTLRAMIAKDGTTEGITVLSGDPIFATAAVDAVRQWRYKPTMLNGVPVVTETQIILKFVPPGK
jgi:TonB family protein